MKAQNHDGDMYICMHICVFMYIIILLMGKVLHCLKCTVSWRQYGILLITDSNRRLPISGVQFYQDAWIERGLLPILGPRWM